MSLLKSMVRDIERAKQPKLATHDEDREEFADLDQALAVHHKNKTQSYHHEEDQEEGDFVPDEDDENDDIDDEDEDQDQDENEDQDEFDMTDLADGDEDPDEEDPNRQGLIRTVPGAHLVYKRAQQDGSYEELWIYNIRDNDFDSELKTRRGILGGTDIPMNKMQSPDGSQSYELWTAGNAQLLRISGLPS